MLTLLIRFIMQLAYFLQFIEKNDLVLYSTIQFYANTQDFASSYGLVRFCVCLCLYVRFAGLLLSFFDVCRF